MELIINSVKSAIYDALFDYWNVPPNLALLASLLDPRSKTMYGWPIDLQETAKSLLKAEYEKFKELEVEPIDEFYNQQSNQNTFISKIFGPPESHLSSNNEINNYLDNIHVSPAHSNMDPFQWWRDNEKKFPILFRIARRYLGIPATSVPSERLFSDAGNQISSERNRLKADTVSELLFLKRNMEYVNPFV